MPDATLTALARSWSAKRILVLGDVMLDEYVWGEARRISPEAPVPVVEYRRRSDRPGGAGNTAANVVSLGGQAVLGGIVGADDPADRLRAALAEGGVLASGLVADPARPTTTKTRILAHGQQVVRLDRETATSVPAAAEARLLAWAETETGRADACVLADYGKGVVTPSLAQALIAACRRQQRPVVVDPKGSDFVKYRGAAVVKPNMGEAAQCLNRPVRDPAELESAGRALVDLLEGSAVLISCGAEGMTLFRPDTPSLHLPARAQAVFDVTGAGDTVIGVLALALAAGAPLPDAARLANRAAALAVAQVGTAAVALAALLVDLAE